MPEKPPIKFGYAPRPRRHSRRAAALTVIALLFGTAGLYAGVRSVRAQSPGSSGADFCGACGAEARRKALEQYGDPGYLTLTALACGGVGLVAGVHAIRARHA